MKLNSGFQPTLFRCAPQRAKPYRYDFIDANANVGPVLGRIVLPIP